MIEKSHLEEAHEVIKEDILKIRQICPVSAVICLPEYAHGLEELLLRKVDKYLPSEQFKPDFSEKYPANLFFEIGGLLTFNHELRDVCFWDSTNCKVIRDDKGEIIEAYLQSPKISIELKDLRDVIMWHTHPVGSARFSKNESTFGELSRGDIDAVISMRNQLKVYDSEPGIFSVIFRPQENRFYWYQMIR